MKKLIGISIGLLLLVVFGIMYMAPMFNKSANMSMTASKAMEDLSYSIENSVGGESRDNRPAAQNTKDEGSNQGLVKNQQVKKIIKDADVSIEVKDIDQDFKSISQWIQSNGGYEFSRNQSSSSNQKHITVVYKIPPEKLNSFIQMLGEAVKVKNTSIRSNDITDQYYDSIARLENLKNGRAQLLEIQKKAVTIDEILRVQDELTRITGEIESLQGRLKMWDKLVAESTVNLSITEEADPMKPVEEISWKFSSWSDIWKTMKNGFIWTTNTLANVFVWCVIILVSVSPLIGLAVLVLIVVRFINNKKNK